MEGNEDPHTPERSKGIKIGDIVHVYNGTSLGTRAYRIIAYIATVVGTIAYIAIAYIAGMFCVLSCLALSVLCVCHSSIVLSCKGSQHHDG
jgi:hypothetical protein